MLPAQTLEPLFEGRYVPDPMSGCWLWTGALNSQGYGLINKRVDGRAWQIVASRVAYVLHNGPIPDGLCVLHHCDVRSCVNPGHLFLGTKGDNNRDCATKGRYPAQQKTECRNGHPYSSANTYRHKGTRYCRECHRESAARRQYSNGVGRIEAINGRP